MRGEIKFAKKCIVEMQEQIKQLKSTATKANEKSINFSKTTSEHNNWILSLKAKSEEGKVEFESEVKKLQEKLQDRYETEPVKEDDLDGKKKGKADDKKYDNPIEILKIRLKNIH